MNKKILTLFAGMLFISGTASCWTWGDVKSKAAQAEAAIKRRAQQEKMRIERAINQLRSEAKKHDLSLDKIKADIRKAEGAAKKALQQRKKQIEVAKKRVEAEIKKHRRQ